jgi:hypothetical protein
VVVISEETGTVSIAINGRLHRGLSEEALRQRLIELLQIGELRPKLVATPLGQVASRVGDALKTARTRDRSRSERTAERPSRKA